MPGSIWIVRRNANGTWGTPTQRTTFGSNPIWSPDGRWIAFPTSPFAASLAVMHPDSGSPRILLDSASSGVAVEQPYWSRDSRTIYFKSHDARGDAEFWSIPVTGGKPTLLTRFRDPRRPSGRSFWGLGPGRMYFELEDRQSQVWVMDATLR